MLPSIQTPRADKYIIAEGGMTLEEIIEAGAGEQRVQRMNVTAKLAKNEASQLKDLMLARKY